MRLMAFLLISINLSALSQQADPERAKPPQGDIKVQSIPWEPSGWQEQNLEPVSVLSSDLNGVKVSGVCHYPKMYVITVPEGFDGFVSLDSARKSDFRIQAWPEFPNRANFSHGILKFVSTGNKISFKNTENKASTLYLSINLTIGDIRYGEAPFTLTIQNLNKKLKPNSCNRPPNLPLNLDATSAI